MPDYNRIFISLGGGGGGGGAAAFEFGLAGTGGGDSPATALIGGLKTTDALAPLNQMGVNSISILSGASANTMLATGISAIAFGNDVTASNEASFAAGGGSGTEGARSIGLASVALGGGRNTVDGALATASNALAIMRGSVCTGASGVCIGLTTLVSMADGIAIGSNSQSTASQAVSLGQGITNAIAFTTRFRAALFDKRNKTSTSGPVTVSVLESNTTFTNQGASGSVTYNLPAAAIGLVYTFIVGDNASDTIVVDADGADTITISGSVTAAGTITGSVERQTVTLECFVVGQWAATSTVGTWT